MATVTISDDQGQLMVTVDGGEPQPVQNAEDACQIVEATFNQPDQDDQSMNPEDMTTEGMEQMSEEDAMGAGFKGVRGSGLNG